MTRAVLGIILVCLSAAVGCSSSGTADTSSTSGSSTSSAGSGGSGGSPTVISDVRDDRYCEVLLGKIQGAEVHVDVYNTYLLNDCPDAAWTALDKNQIKADHMVDAVILNGPRRWLIDAFANSKLLDPTVVTFGSLEMRLAGQLAVPLSDVTGGAMPYTPRNVARTTTFVFDTGKPVYELVDPMGRVFDMQSYSIAMGDLPEASLAGLGAALTLPTGWTYRTRTLDANLDVTAIDGVATVVQDDHGNTYQLSQVTP